MPVAHYNSYLSTGASHPTYRNYDAERSMGPPAVSFSSGVPLPVRPQGPPPPAPLPPSVHNGSSSNSVNVPNFSLPPSGVPYTGPFPVHQNEVSNASYQGRHNQMSSSQNLTNLSSSQGARTSLEAGSSNGCPVGYPAGMGYPSPHPQQLAPHVMDPHDHYMGSRSHNYSGQQYPLFRTPPEESSRFHPHQFHPQHLHQEHSHNQTLQHDRTGTDSQLSAGLSTIFEEGADGNGGKYNIGGGGSCSSYLQHPVSEVSPYHSAGQTGLTSAEMQDRHARPPSLGTPQLLQQPKTEPEWWHDSDVLDRLEQIRLHSDNPPPRDRTTTRRRRRNSEKRKEKSRDAARCRRGKESEIFTELANALPLPARTISMLDKASVMRLTIAFLKTRALCHACLSKKYDSEGAKKIDIEMDSLFLKALDGFLLVLSAEGDIIYSSENIASFLGLPQVDVMGQSIYDYTHPCDHEEARALVSSKGPQEPRHAFLRLKCTLTAKGRSVNLGRSGTLKSASYKVVRVSGELVKGEDDAWLVALCTPVPHPSNIEFPLDKQTFVSKHSLDMKFTYVDDNVSEFCGYVGDELMGRSLYEMHHALDTDLIKDAYKTLRIKGQVETGRYRFLARDGGYVWVVTQATLIHGPKDHKPQYVVCLNYVVSGVESPGEVLSELQLRCSKSQNAKQSAESLDCGVPVALSGPTSATHKVLQPKSDIQPKVVNDIPARPAPSRVVSAQPQPPTPVATTSKIFTPRTEEMNKGYLIFPDDQPFGIELKDEPEDLTHLAPSGGDTCVRLEIPIFKPELDDVFTLDFKQIPISHADGALFTSPTAISENILEQGSIPEYDEYEVTDRGKACNRLSGGKITVNKNGSCSPSSNCSSPGSVCGLRTPEPPKPLLSQASVFQSSQEIRPSQRRVVESSRPVSTTESLFTQLNETAHESYAELDLKLENQNMDLDEFDLRAPFIPLSNESLMLNQDDLMWGAHPDPIILPNSLPMGKRNLKYPNLLHGDEDSSLAQLLRDRDPPIAGSGPEKDLDSRNPNDPHCSQYQQSKFLDGGGSFVDPNQVLPGHFSGKDGDDGTGGHSVEDDPPQVMMHETVEPPPPLLNVDAHPQDSLSVKRHHSPNSSPLLGHKKLCSLLYEHQQQRSPLQEQHSPLRSSEGSQHQVPQIHSHPSGIRELTTPYAPTMQQLLISKEPITVRSGRPGGGGGGGGSGGGISAPLSMHKGKDSVLRNLLNLNGERDDSSREGGTKVLTAPVRLTQDRMTAMLVADGGSNRLSYPKLRILTGSGGSLMQMTSGSDGGGGGGNNSNNSSAGVGERFIQRSRRQDPLLLVDPDLTIPSLSELSQLDFEVNAPANIGNLLQGADLLMALDQA